MHGNVTARRLSGDQQERRSDGTTESRIDTLASLPDITCLRLSALAELDDLLLAATVRRLLPSFAAIEGRLWDQNTNEGHG